MKKQIAGAVVALLAVLALGACSGITVNSGLGYVLDSAPVVEAVGAECSGAESVTIAPAFEVDWSDGKTTYGGGGFIGCGSKMFQFVCRQEKPEDGSKPGWTCEPLDLWEKAEE